MSRYTAKDLEEAVKDVNATLRRAGFTHSYWVGGSYGRTDLYRSVAGSSGAYKLEAGTPRECRAELYRQAYWSLIQKFVPEEGNG